MNTTTSRKRRRSLAPVTTPEVEAIFEDLTKVHAEQQRAQERANKIGELVATLRYYKRVPNNEIAARLGVSPARAAAIYSNYLDKNPGFAPDAAEAV